MPVGGLSGIIADSFLWTQGKPMGFTTKQIHAGVTPDPVTGAILTPI